MKVNGRHSFRGPVKIASGLPAAANLNARGLPSQIGSGRARQVQIFQSPATPPQITKSPSLFQKFLGVIGLADRHPYTPSALHNKWIFLENIAAALPFSASAHFVWSHKIIGSVYTAGLLALSTVSIFKIGPYGEALFNFFSTPVGTLLFVFKLAFHLEHLRALVTPFNVNKMPPPTMLLDFFDRMRRVPLVAHAVTFGITAFLVEANLQVSNNFKYDPETISGMFHDVAYKIPLGFSGYLQTILLLGLTASIQAGSRDRFSRVTRAPMDAPVFFYNECRRHPWFATSVITGVSILLANTFINLGAQAAIFKAIQNFPLTAPGVLIALFSGIAAVRAVAAGQSDSRVKRLGDSPWHWFVKAGMHKSLGKYASGVAGVFTGFYLLRLTGATDFGAWLSQSISSLSWRWLAEPMIAIAQTFALAVFGGYFYLWAKTPTLDPAVRYDQPSSVDYDAVLDLEAKKAEEGR